MVSSWIVSWRVNLGIRPLDGESRPSQGARGGDRFRVAQAITKRRSVWREPIRLGEAEGQLKPGVFTELHEDTEVVSERKL